MIGKLASICRHAATSRCDVFSSDSSRGFTRRTQRHAAARPPSDKPWHTPTHSAPVQASIENVQPPPRWFLLRDSHPRLPTPQRDVPTHTLLVLQSSHENRYRETLPPAPFPSGKGCSKWTLPGGGAWPAARAGRRGPIRSDMTAQLLAWLHCRLQRKRCQERRFPSLGYSLAGKHRNGLHYRLQINRQTSKSVACDSANFSAHQFFDGPSRFDYETPWFNELLLANVLSPVGA